MFLNISQNSKENACARVSSLIQLQDWGLQLKKETLAQLFSCEFCEILGTPFLQNTSSGYFSILIQLKDFNCIKHRRGMKTVSLFAFLKRELTFKSSHWELFCKKGVLMCFFVSEFEVFWIVQSRGSLNKIRCSFKTLPFCVGYWRDLDYNWRANSKHPGELGILVKIYIFSWDNRMAFLWGICLLPEKMTLFFSILNKYLQLSGTWGVLSNNWVSSKCTSFNFICCTRIADLLENKPVLISGKTIWGKNSLLSEETFCCQPMSTLWIRHTKEHLFYSTYPSVCFWILSLFCFRIE